MQWEEGEEPAGRRDRRQARLRNRAQAREQRWQHNRLAVPYRTDGPKITFGILWFGAVVGATAYGPLAVAAVVAAVAGLAGLQAGYAWFPELLVTRWWTAMAAFIAGLGGFIGPVGLFAGLGLAVAVLLVYLITNPIHHRPPGELLDVLFRSSLPLGLAAGSLAALAEFDRGAVISLVLLVSAYEMGDFLVGSGSANAVEGPISGLVALAAVVFILWVVSPTPFTARSMVLFGALAGVCCPLGQIYASALLPRGSAWAPAVRRIDSYLLAAPLWLILLTTAPAATAL